MPIPPVVRLSQVLFSDVPTVASARSTPNSSSPSRKRDHAHVSDDIPFAATQVRLLLPSTFVVANRAYQSEYGSALACVEQKEENESLDGSRYCTLQRHCMGVQKYENNASKCSTIACVADSSSSSGSSSSPSGGSSIDRSWTNPGGQQQHCHHQSVSTMAAVEPRGRDSLMVVVESVLGFSVLRALLERSHTDPAASSQDSPSPEDQPYCLEACSEAPHDDDEVTSSEDRGGYFDAGVAEAVGRLVGWLRIVAARETLRKRPGLDGQLVETSKNRDLGGEGTTNDKNSLSAYIEMGAGIVLEDEDTPAAAAAAAALVAFGGCCVGGMLYEVTGRPANGNDWSVFTLEPSYLATEGETVRRRTRSRDCARPTALQVKVICHPLVTMEPDIRWCLRLISQAKSIARLLNANAKLSTLGGGYFLTRQVGQAIRLAQAQSEVATALGNLQLAAKCRINEAYNYIWLGHYAEARRIIRAQMLTSRTFHDKEVANMAAIAAQFLRKSKKANRRLLGHCIVDERSDRNGNHIKWVKQRIDVKTDDWHRVRALPLYSNVGGAGPLDT